MYIYSVFIFLITVVNKVLRRGPGFSCFCMGLSHAGLGGPYMRDQLHGNGAMDGLGDTGGCVLGPASGTNGLRCGMFLDLTVTTRVGQPAAVESLVLVGVESGNISCFGLFVLDVGLGMYLLVSSG